MILSNRNFDKAIIFLLFLILSLFSPIDGHTAPTLEQLKEGIQTALEQAAGEALPPGVGDLVSAAKASPDVTKRALTAWLDQKIQKAVLDGNWDKVGRYQKFRDSIATGNPPAPSTPPSTPAPDKEDPLISFWNPSGSGSYSTNTPSVDISGTTSDNVGVTKVTWSNSKGGSGTCTGTDNWSAGGIILQSGDNVITVTAHDAAGNTGTDTITVTYTQPDSRSPAVWITKPSTGETYPTGTSSINIAGSASDNVGVTKVTWSNNRGGSGTCTGTDNWSASGITLKSGDNMITVTAFDAAGNSMWDFINVIYTPPDNTPPAVSITKPTSSGSYSTGTSPLNIGGTASDNVGVTQVIWWNVRSNSRGTCTGTDNWSAGGIALQSGINKIIVIAYDAAGHSMSDTITVTYTPPDKTAPAVLITTPSASGSYSTGTSPLNIGGSASDDVGVKQVTWSNNKGGSGTCTGTDNWSAGGIALQSGDNVITVTASDAAGNKGTSTLTVTYTPPKPLRAEIKIQKVANARDVRPGESVTYTYSVTNTGEVELDTIKVADDKCSTVNYLSGDTNGNTILDPKETWIYECSVALKATTKNTATAEGYSPAKVRVADQATATVTVGPCPPGKVPVPYLLNMTEEEAIAELKKSKLAAKVELKYNDRYKAGTVMEQNPYAGECVDPNSVVNLIVSKGPEPEEPPKPANLTAEIDCGSSFELAPGDLIGRSCGIIVKGWESNTERRVEVKVTYNTNSGIEIFPGDTSAPPSLMYTAGIQDTYDRYIFSEHFTAKDSAPPGTTAVTITVSQEGAGSVTFTINVEVLKKGLSPSSGSGIRPPATVAAGSGGEYCVWRYKLIGDPPPCFHFVAAVCGSPRYNNPANGYELVGTGMTWGEADARIGELSRYFDDAYGCAGLGAGVKDRDGDGTPDDKDGCPDDPDKISPGVCKCNISDRDSDYDGTPDCVDNCPDDINKISPGICGCGTPDKDSDGDGAMDCNDECPTDPDKTKMGECGCFAPDVDSDGDGVLDCNDRCPNDPAKKTDEGYCGCGKPETDKDGDAWPDCIDNCPNDPYKTDDPGICGCGTPETDSDGDGVPDCKDKCPNDPNKTEPGTAGCGNTENAACPKYDPTNPACEPATSKGPKPPADPNVGSGFQGGMPGNKPAEGGGGGTTTQQPTGYTGTGKPEDGEGGEKTPSAGKPPSQPPYIGIDGQPICQHGWTLGRDGLCNPAPGCPLDWVRGTDGICKPKGSLIPPPKPGDGGSQPTSPGGCPKGCHVRPDGGGCHCPDSGGSGDNPPSSTTPPSSEPPPPKPPTTSTPTGGGGG
ncbi:MAG: PASTA domain-containing protein [Nitrospirae bacterium]|nr:PASTA domain-containing protein [Nitrospirota bacterium]